jgi:hypothetical protein
MLDVMQAVRADEAEHQDVNHSVSGFGYNMVSPLYEPREKMKGMLLKSIRDMMKRNEKVTKDNVTSA